MPCIQIWAVYGKTPLELMVSDTLSMGSATVLGGASGFSSRLSESRAKRWLASFKFKLQIQSDSPDLSRRLLISCVMGAWHSIWIEEYSREARRLVSDAYSLWKLQLSHVATTAHR